MTTKFRCFLVGAGAIVFQAAEKLRDKGFDLRGCYSFDGALVSWAKDYGIFHYDSVRAFEEALLSAEFDYLFSMNNPWLIPETVITRATKEVINFHDSPLPQYAGVNSTVWALINGETRHGTTLHCVNAGIDRGPILKQQIIDIFPTDTVTTLNSRILEKTLILLESLLDDINLEQVTYTPQDETKRSYYSSTERPPNACILSFKRPAQQVANLVRALAFAPAKNPIGTPKLWFGTVIVSVGSAKVGKTSRQEANSIEKIKHESGLLTSLVVSTADRDIEISQIRCLDGSAVSVDVLEAAGISEGSTLPEISSKLSDQLACYVRKTSRCCNVFLSDLNFPPNNPTFR